MTDVKKRTKNSYRESISVYLSSDHERVIKISEICSKEKEILSSSKSLLYEFVKEALNAYYINYLLKY